MSDDPSLSALDHDKLVEPRSKTAANKNGLDRLNRIKTIEHLVHRKKKVVIDKQSTSSQNQKEIFGYFLTANKMVVPI